MGTLHRLAAAGDAVTLGHGITAYLATLVGAEQAGTGPSTAASCAASARISARAWRWPSSAPSAFAEWFTGQWDDRAPGTWNVALDAFRSAVAYWAEQGWITADPTRLLRGAAAAPGPQPGTVPRRGRAAAHPRGHRRCASACCGACCTRPRRGRPRCSAWTWRTWTCPTGAPGSAARAAPST